MDKYESTLEAHQRYKSQKVISGIVMATGPNLREARVVSLGAGTRCSVPQANRHTRLCDMHAEVLTRRGLVAFLHQQLMDLCNGKAQMIFESTAKTYRRSFSGKASIFQRSQTDQVRLKDGVSFHLYINAIPCGDARVFCLKGCYDLKDR